jgi:uncharacterized membrane protein
VPREFVSPNLHVALVHFPLALLIVGTLIELFSFMYRRHAFRAAGRWMILLGALAGIPTAMSGIYALADVSRMGLTLEEASGPWREVAGRSPLWQNPQQARLMRDHVVLQGWAAGLAVIVVVLWVGASDAWRARLHLPLLAVLVICSGLTVAGGWHAGEAVYRHGTGVYVAPANEPVATQQDPAAGVAAEEGAASSQQRRIKEQVEYFFPPLQMHVIFAGVTIALAVTALALSFRATNQVPPRTELDYIAAALGPPDEAAAGRPVEHGRKRDPQDIGPRVPSARFWLLTCLAGLLTAAGGYWVLASEMEQWSQPQVIWNLIIEPSPALSPPWLTRRTAHVGGGVSLILLSLLMAMVARFTPRSRLLLAFFALLLLAVLAGQVWFGVLLTYDTVEGPLTRFN